MTHEFIAMPQNRQKSFWKCLNKYKTQVDILFCVCTGKSRSSPASSRSSSRNSSLSPRERSGSVTSVKSGGGGAAGSGVSPKSDKSSKNGSSSSSSSSGTPSTSSKKMKMSPVPNGPLIPWSKRNNGVPKVCNGWQWEGESRIQKVYLNVSDGFNFFRPYVLIPSNCILHCKD